MIALGGGGPFGVVDIGTGKIACMIVAPGKGGAAPILAGFGHQRSRGVKAGVVVDLDAAEKAVRAAIGQAERMAGFSIAEVVVSVACGRLKSLHFSAAADVDTGIVTRGDIGRLTNAACSFAARDGRMLVHLEALSYRLGDVAGVAKPIGLAARRIDGDFHAVVADEAPLRNLLMLVERSDLSVAGLVPAPHAAALAVTTPAERHAGVTCIDIGAGTTTIASYVDGRLISVDAIPVGGQHVTFDLARALTTPLEEAERIKTLYGTLAEAASDDQEAVSYTLVRQDEQETYQVPRAFIRQVVHARMAMVLDLVAERVTAAPACHWLGSKVIVTGGASQTVGLASMAERRLGRPVSVGRPHETHGLSPSLSTPALATVIGLVSAVASADRPNAGGKAGDARYVGRVKHWLRESF
jgi:cell division protein FtsA